MYSRNCVGHTSSETSNTQKTWCTKGMQDSIKLKQNVGLVAKDWKEQYVRINRENN